MMCPTCGGAMLTERPHRHSATDRTPSTAAGRAWLATPAGQIVTGMRDAILAIEAGAPLDVDRLARALHATARREHIGLLPDLTACTSADVHHEDAAAIAREYAALEEPTP